MSFGTRSSVVTLILATVLLLATAPRCAQAATRPVAGPAWAGMGEIHVDPTPTEPDPGRMAQQLLERINQTRWEQGQVPPLKAHPVLQRAAQSHCQSMAQDDFFGHQGTDGSPPWDRIDAAGYGDWYLLAENIAAGYQTPEEVKQAWLASPRHRENLLNPEIHEAGVGYFYQGGDLYPGGTWGYEHYWTLDMGTRWDAFPVVINGEAYSTTTTLVSLYLYGQNWAQEVRLSSDRINWTDWQPYQCQLSWELEPGYGIRRVYAELRDEAGNLTQSQDEIVLVSPGPPETTPVPSVTPAQAVFVVQWGRTAGLPRQYNLRISSTAGEARTWNASLNRSWLYVTPSAGTTPSEARLYTTGLVFFLPTGLHKATLTIQVEEDTIEVPVHLLILPRLYPVYLPSVGRHDNR